MERDRFDQACRYAAKLDPVGLLCWLLGGLAQVFAEAAGCAEAWRQGLRGWNVRESQVVNAWINEGKAEGKAEAVLRVLRVRFGSPPEDVVALVRGTTDLERLDRWLDAATSSASLDVFRQGLQP